MKGGRASRSHSLSVHGPTNEVAERVERILWTRGLALSEVSRELRQRYEGMPHYFVPHDFYYDLGLPGYSPRMEQVLALSRVSNYRLADWLAVFGLNLDDIPRLQAEFSSARTSLLDGTTYDRASRIAWFRDLSGSAEPPAVAPLGQFIGSAHPRRIDSLLAPEPSPFLYAKIGRQDAFAFPDLLPGSIVRADTRGLGELLGSMHSKNSERLFLVECSEGMVCCRLHASTKGKVTLRASTLPFAQRELRLDSEARILGVLDWELRPSRTSRPEVPTAATKFLSPQARPASGTHPGLRELLERARSQSGLSIRNASLKSRSIADALREDRYFCSPSSLIDYEAAPRLPLRIHKIVSLCVLFSLGFSELLAAAGLDARDSGREPIPDALVGRAIPDSPQSTNDAAGNKTQSRFMSMLIAKFEEIPLFLRYSLAAVTGLPHLSVRDVFWTGGLTASLHPYLRGTVFVSVNRRLKNPVFSSRNYLWEQPVFILLLRDGTYHLAGCSLEGRTLIVHPFSGDFSRPQMLRNGVDAEVVGKVTALFRRLR